MSDEMDDGFRAAVEQDKTLGTHAQIGRAELEQHLREAHGIAAETRLTLKTVGDGQTRVGEDVVELNAIGEARLRASHWRAHELGVAHRQ
jgi:hypothetical protein